MTLGTGLLGVNVLGMPSVQQAAPTVVSQALFRNAARGNKLMSRWPLGNAPSLSLAVDWDAVYSAWIASMRGPSATTYYVSDSIGSNSNDGLTEGAPFADIAYAGSVMSGGDEIVVLDGTITNNDLFAINDYEHTVPSGLSRTNRTIIRAKNPFGVRLQFTDNSRHFNYEAIRLASANYVLIDGFIIDWLNDGGDPQYCAVISAEENIMTRCIFRRDQLGSFGGFVLAPAAYTLLQDVHGVGGARYGIQVGSGGTGVAGQNIVRRSIVRADFNDTNQPMAAFSHYGSNGEPVSGNSEFQNCYAVDGPYIDTGNGTYSYTWGGFYHPKNAFEIRHRGCGVINQGGRAGFWATDNPAAVNYVFEDCAVIGENPVKYGTRVGIHANANGSADRLTLIDIDDASLYNGITAANTYDSDTRPNDVFRPSGGADLRYCYGAFGSVWGEAGFDSITPTELWSFPYEDIIRSVFREPLPSPAGYTPATSDSTRGFCADGQTFTRYIASQGSGDIDTILGGMY